MIPRNATLASKISDTINILLASFYSDTSVNELLWFLSFLLLNASFGVVCNTTISDFCHLVSPKVIGLCTFNSFEWSVFPFLQSAFASSCEDERIPFRVGLLASSSSNEEDERCVNINTFILYMQVVLYYLLQNPTHEKFWGNFFPLFLDSLPLFGFGLRSIVSP